MCISDGLGTALLHSVLTVAPGGRWGTISVFRKQKRAQRGSFVPRSAVRTGQDGVRHRSLSEAGAPALAALPCCPLLSLLIPHEPESVNHKFFSSLIKHQFLTVPESKANRAAVCTKRKKKKKSQQSVQSSLAKPLFSKQRPHDLQRQRSRKTAIILINSLKWKYVK